MKSAAVLAALVFSAGGSRVVLRADELGARFEARRVEVFHPSYGKTMAYRAVALRDVARAAFGAALDEDAFSDAAFIALDGYEAVAPLEVLSRDGAWLALAEDGDGGWTPVGRKHADPGPFLVAWDGPKEDDGVKLPWSYQLAEIKLIRFEDRYPAVLPRGAAKGSAAYRGFELFRRRCLQCHAINRQGGSIGPDLNAPRSIVTYRDAAFLKAYIREPSKFRYGKMPDHRELSDADLDALLAYFGLKSKQPEKDFEP